MMFFKLHNVIFLKIKTMKNNLLKYMILLLWVVTIFALYYFLGKPYWKNLFLHNSETQNIETTLSPAEGICWKWKFKCPALKKINDRLWFMNDITAMGYMIETNSWWTKIAVINFPAFNDYASDEKIKVIQRIKQSNIKILAIGIASKYDDFNPDIQLILKEIPFNELRIRMYVEPDNLIELFDNITWKKDAKMKLSLEFYNAALPEYLKIEDYTYMLDKMIRENNGNIPIASLSFVLNPLFYEFDLRGNIEKNLRNLSTQELHINGVYTIPDNDIPPDEYKKLRWSILYFLENSPIPNIFIENINMKKNNTILY